MFTFIIQARSLHLLWHFDSYFDRNVKCFLECMKRMCNDWVVLVLDGQWWRWWRWWHLICMTLPSSLLNPSPIISHHPAKKKGSAYMNNVRAGVFNAEGRDSIIIRCHRGSCVGTLMMFPYWHPEHSKKEIKTATLKTRWKVFKVNWWLNPIGEQLALALISKC